MALLEIGFVGSNPENILWKYQALKSKNISRSNQGGSTLESSSVALTTPRVLDMLSNAHEAGFFGALASRLGCTGGGGGGEVGGGGGDLGGGGGARIKWMGIWDGISYQGGMEASSVLSNKDIGS